MSELLNKIEKDRKQALLDGDKFAYQKLTTLLGEASPSGNATTTDEKVQAVVKKFLKNIDETIGYTIDKTCHYNLVAEAKLLEKYLPKQLTAEEIEHILNTQMTVYFDGMGHGTNVGTVMAFLKGNYSGQYNGKTASQVAKKFLDSFKKV